MREINRWENPSQSISPLLFDGDEDPHFFAVVHTWRVFWKAANEKAAIKIKSIVSKVNVLVVSAFFMALV